MHLRLGSTIGEIAHQAIEAASLFDVLGIDYVCHSEMSLSEACAAAGLDAVHVERALEQLAVPKPVDERLLDASLKDLIRELTNSRFPAVRQALARIAAAVAAASRGGAEQPDAGLTRALSQVTTCIQRHLRDEEAAVFPLITRLEEAWLASATIESSSRSNLAAAIESFVAEHETLVARMAGLRRAICVASGEVRRSSALREALLDLDSEIRQHVDLQNDVLYPRVAVLASASTGSVPAHTGA